MNSPRSRGQSSAGRGSKYNSWGNGNAKNGGLNDEKTKRTIASDGKPAWLSQDVNNTVTALNGNPTSNIDHSGYIDSTNTTSNSGVNKKPLWLTQSSLSSCDTKPLWLNQTLASNQMKPAWLNATTSHATVTTTTTNTAIVDQAKVTTPKPAWLTKSSGIKPILKTVTKQAKTLSDQDVNEIVPPPPPPPPSHPPPSNQPNIQQLQKPFHSVTSAVMVCSKPKKKIKDDKEVQGIV